MDNSTIFLSPVQTVNLLPLFHYLNVLGEIFYAEKLLANENKRKPFLIINAFYNHLNRTSNETEAKRKLVQKCLKGSDLYGGQENETLDLEYVNKTLNYIVTNVVFSQTGNLYGYLAEIVRLSGLKLSVFKRKIKKQLSHLRHLNDDGTVSKLTKLATTKIAETLIWPLFPNPLYDMKIINVKYIYALAGYNFAQSAQMNLSDVSFKRCAILAMTMEASVIGGELPNSTLQIFALPAMIYYAYKEKAKFNQQSAKYLIKDEDFWSDAFFTLFTYLNSTFETIRQTALAANSVYQFHQVMSNFKNRTTLARDVLHEHCKNHNERHLESLVNDYKTFSSNTRCEKKLLPNLELVYVAQFYSIQEKYRLMEIDFIESAFDEFPTLRDLIDSTNTAVYRSKPKNFPMYCMLCPPMSPKYKRNINFFVVKNEYQTEFFALEQNQNNFTLLVQKDNKAEFNRRVGLPWDTDLEVTVIVKIFKARGQDFNAFVEYIAQIKAEEFRYQLYEYGYDKTSTEKFVEILESFIPFYHCVKYANAGQQGMAALTCFGDVLSFLPFGELANLGLKISTTVTSRFFKASGLTLRTLTLKQAIFTILTTGLENVANDLGNIFNKVIFTKQMFKTLSKTVLRSLDFGFEPIGKLVWHGSAMIGKVFRTKLKHIVEKFRLLKLKLDKFESIWQYLESKSGKPVDGSEMIFEPDRIENREVYRLIYPGGENPSGPRYIRLSSGHAELRRIVGFKQASPVVISRVSRRGKVFYRKVNLQTEEAYGLELKLNKHGQLENIRQPFRKHLYEIKTKGLSGRGALMTKRQQSIGRAAQLVVDANIGVSRQEAEVIMRHYVLGVYNPSNVDDLMNMEVEPIDFGDFDVMDVINDNVIGIGGSFAVDPSMSKNLPVPTYHDFALEWVRTLKRNPESYKKFHIQRPAEFERLSYNSERVDSNYKRLDRIKTRILETYGSDFYQKMQVDISLACKHYKERKLFQHLKLEDYYALLIWEKLDFNNVTPGIVSMQIKKALYRLAVREATGESSALSKIVYRLEVRSPAQHEQDILQLKNQIIETNNIRLAISEEEVYKKILRRDIYGGLTSGETTQFFMYEIHADPDLVVDLNGIISSEDKFALLPDMKYIVHNVEKKNVVGSEVNYIVMYSLPVVKEEVIAKLLNEIKKPGVSIG